MGFAALIKPPFYGNDGSSAALWPSRRRSGLHNHSEYLDILIFIGRYDEPFYSDHSVNETGNRLLGNGSNLRWTGNGFAPPHPAVFAATSAGALLFLAIPLLLRPSPEDRTGVSLHVCSATLCLNVVSPVT